MLDTWFEAVGSTSKIFFRKRLVYDTLSAYWAKDLGDLSNCMLVSSGYGGVIAVTRDTRYIPKIKPSALKQTIYTHTSAGKPVGKYSWEDKNLGALLYMFWSDDELLVCVSKTGTIAILGLFGTPILKYNVNFEALVNEHSENENDKLTFEYVLACAHWSNGVALLTYHKGVGRTVLKVWTIANIREPNIEEINEIEFNEELDETKRFDMTVLSPDMSNLPFLRIYVCYEISGSISVFTVYPDDVAETEQQHNSSIDKMALNGPFTNVQISPSGKTVALVTTRGGVFFTNENLNPINETGQYQQFETGIAIPPDQLEWCGEDAVCLRWTKNNSSGTSEYSTVLLVTKIGQCLPFVYTGACYIVPEIDIARVITEDSCEIIQKVPDSTYNVFRIGSDHPSAMLYDAFIEFERKQSSCVKSIRAIDQVHLVTAVKTCLEAAASEFDTVIQNRLLKAAAYGKAFCYPQMIADVHKSFNTICKNIRVMNNVRKHAPDEYLTAGMPLTVRQYESLCIDGKPRILVDRLVNRLEHRLAFCICHYLELNSQGVFLHWACSKLSETSKDFKIMQQRQRIDHGNEISDAELFVEYRKQLVSAILENREEFGDGSLSLIALSSFYSGSDFELEFTESERIADAKVQIQNISNNLGEALLSKKSKANTSSDHKNRKTTLTKIFLDEEENLVERIPLLLKLGRISEASDLAMESSDTEILSFLVLCFRYKIEGHLAHIRKLKDKAERMTRDWYAEEIKKYLSVLCQYEESKKLFIVLCKEMNPTLITDLHRMFESDPAMHNDEDFQPVRRMFEEYITAIALQKAITAPTPDKSIIQLRDARKFIKTAEAGLLSNIASQILPDNEYLEMSDIILINKQSKLVEIQKDIQNNRRVRCHGLPLYQTLELAIRLQDNENEELLVKEFGIDFSRYILLKINTLADCKLLTELKEFAESDFLELERRVAVFDGIDEGVVALKSKLLTYISSSITHPPTGFEPFAEACLRNGLKKEALFYLEKVTNIAFKVNFLLEIPDYVEALKIVAAAPSKQLELLKTVRKRIKFDKMSTSDRKKLLDLSANLKSDIKANRNWL